ncbi:hypothetical protein Tco_1048660 [Tanacetum coccineum]
MTRHLMMVRSCEEVWIFLLELIFTFPRKLRTPPRVPSNLDNWDTHCLIVTRDPDVLQALQQNESLSILLADLQRNVTNKIVRITFLQVGYMKRIVDPAHSLRKLIVLGKWLLNLFPIP